MLFIWNPNYKQVITFNIQAFLITKTKQGIGT